MLLFSYLVALVTLGSAAYFLYPVVKSWFVPPQAKTTGSKRRTVPAKREISSPVAAVGPTYDPDFIPEIHLKQRRAVSGAAKIPTGEPTSGSEAEGTDASTKASGTAAVGRTTRRRKR
jgi:hypothetical protein